MKLDIKIGKDGVIRDQFGRILHMEGNTVRRIGSRHGGYKSSGYRNLKVEVERDEKATVCREYFSNSRKKSG